MLLNVLPCLPLLVYVKDSYMSGKTHSGSHHHLMECFLLSHLSQAEGGQSSWREVGEGGRLELRSEGMGDS